ncbi:hypothetical protein LTR10_015374 [Elasticomyces elasticus]|uniref:RNA-binding S4 domain-containing protein n=1 Tax=Exophiala sideris TaxID=1016849 RepID=A0ABR0JJ88_9EURO|nr:hypothetical protein LTR10_015374 [Elasticomyces elasticus]KAK5030226.1 hypothetical protein LTR13_008244 [Exophiala sideris]KAK5035118.1 hypothetical protein LTS07_002554 [Exophiala sideris]KAK5066041.1 hypothetical protein LTR69_002559 [Exophiala sideris]KAK5178291.1 hypothetical protein LTR44_009166 [Eurotiomycetes sp. CCFEE 6388]
MRNRATTRLKYSPKRSPQVRQSWSKYNLYNLSRAQPVSKNSNFFKTKWVAKALTRSYHGEQVREKQWVRMFDRRIRSVVPMNAGYLAMNDGSLESAGRGSGVEEKQIGRRRRERGSKDDGDRRRERGSKDDGDRKQIPYMQMTFAPLERRLDTAIFRAMFASSARQARQFVVHGAVKVNGKEMRYPGYLLNPGDMFQVVPERVMYATGAPKVVEKAKATEEENTENTETEAAAETASEEVEPESKSQEEDIDVDQDPREVLKALQTQAKSILGQNKKDLGAKGKQNLRAFSKAVRRLLSKSKASGLPRNDAEAQFAEIQQQLNIRRENQAAGTTALPSARDAATPSENVETTEAATEPATQPQTSKQETSLSDDDYNELLSALRTMNENPVDESKPYATPWMPRDFMSAFAFIPRYLEVSHKICAAVYLRHPVARPGLAEVPTPYNDYTNSSAFTWYLRRW